MLFDRHEELLDYWNVSYKTYSNYYAGSCPIHMGDNQSAWNFYFSNYKSDIYGFWQCRTHNCHSIFRPTILGLVRGFLSRKNGWRKEGDVIVSFSETLNWVFDFLKISMNEVKTQENLNYKKIIRLEQMIPPQTPPPYDFAIPRHRVIQYLNIPSPYFLKRYMENTLIYYDVGVSLTGNINYLNRSIVPIYNSKKEMVFFTSRTHLSQCKKCKTYHHPNEECRNAVKIPKWKNPKGNISRFLYNIENSNEILDKKTVILCEGAPDVWRLYEKSINLGLAIFGTSLSDEQQIILESMGIRNVILALDMDEAGRSACRKIQQKLSYIFNVDIVEYSAKDVGELTDFSPFYQIFKRRKINI